MRIAFAAAVVVTTLLAGCPPPPPPPHDAGPPPDSGVPGKAGDPCFSPTSTNDCDVGLECGQLVDADAGVFGCVVPGDVDAGCLFIGANTGEPTPPDDGCQAGLVCGVANSCARKGVIGAPCTSPTECDAFNCGKLPDGSASVCVVNDCLNGCPNGKVCLQAGQCGLTCVNPPGAGGACITAGTDVCSPVNVDCAPGLECFVGDPNTVVTCDVPTDQGGCNLSTPQDGCTADHVCDPTTNSCQQP